MPRPKSGIVLRQGVAVGAETAKRAADSIVSALDSGMNGVAFGSSDSETVLTSFNPDIDVNAADNEAEPANDVIPWVVPAFTGNEDLSFAARQCPGGIYAYLEERFAEYKSNRAGHANFLAFAEYEEHFHAFPQNYGDHVSYRRFKDEDHTFTGFGEVMPIAEGTMLGAMGCHFVGPVGKRNRIDDNTKVRPAVVVGPPTLASPELTAIYNNQIMCPNGVFIADEEKEPGFDAKECVRTHSKSVDGVGNLLYLVLPAKYASSVSKTVANRKRLVRGDHVPNDDDTTRVDNDTEIKLDRLYDPRLQSDYGGRIFNHTFARLKAQPIYDKLNRLTRPWTVATDLRPGTLIMFETTFHCYKYQKRKIYQLNVQTIKILADSPFVAPLLTSPVFPDLGDDDEGGNRSKAGNSTLLAFGVKRVRI